MSYSNFLDEIKKGLPLTNYILIASDPFLHTEAVSLIKDLVPTDQRDFSFLTFDLLATKDEGTPFEHILDALNTVPFFGGRKYVVIENIQKLPKKEFKKLENYIASPSESSAMILLNAGTVKKDVKDRLKGAKQIMLDIRESEIPFWLKAKAETKGLELSKSAVEYLLGTIGPDLGMLSSELDKFMLIGKKKISKEDIVEIIEGKRTYNAFALVDAIKARDTERVFSIYNVLRTTEEPYSLLGVLNWQFGQFLSNKNTPQDREYYYNAFNLLHEADIEIKSSGSFYPLELLLTRLLKLSKQR